MRNEAILAPIHPENRPQIKVNPSLNQNPNFLGPQWARLERDKIIPVSPKVSLINSVVALETLPAKQQKSKNEEVIEHTITLLTPKIDEIKKSLAYNPSKRSTHIDGRWVIRRRGRSGCRCDGDERSAGCRSRSCRNKDKEVKPIDIRSKSNRRVSGKSETRTRTTIRIAKSSDQKA